MRRLSKRFVRLVKQELDKCITEPECVELSTCVALKLPQGDSSRWGLKHDEIIVMSKGTCMELYRRGHLDGVGFWSLADQANEPIPF